MNYDRIEVIFIYFAIKVGSVTNAQRGVRALKSKGYKASLGRIKNPHPNDGCGYVIKTFSDSEQAVVRILENAGVSVLGVEE